MRAKLQPFEAGWTQDTIDHISIKTLNPKCLHMVYSGALGETDYWKKKPEVKNLCQAPFNLQYLKILETFLHFTPITTNLFTPPPTPNSPHNLKRIWRCLCGCGSGCQVRVLLTSKGLNECFRFRFRLQPKNNFTSTCSLLQLHRNKHDYIP
jgi:hypothetical protein